MSDIFLDIEMFSEVEAEQFFDIEELRYEEAELYQVITEGMV